MLSLPINAGPNVRGALNLYSTHINAFTTSQRAQAETFSTEASRALRLALHITNQAQLTHHLETAIASRSVIDQAIGIIMGQNRCTATHAFDILRAASSHRNIKLHDVAHTIVTHISHTPEPSPGVPFHP